MGKLILVRHGESIWNASDKLTGQADVPLTNKGKLQAREIGKKLRPIMISAAFVSTLERAAQTLHEIQLCRDEGSLPIITNAALNERDFGLLTGQLKAEVESQLGPTAFFTMIKGWDTPAPSGESLKDVHRRVTDYFETTILPSLSSEQTILVVSHHQALRALIKHLDRLTEEEVVKLRFAHGEIIGYNFDHNGNLTGKELLSE